MVDPYNGKIPVADFDLTDGQLAEIADVFCNTTRLGLAQDDAEIKCLPVFIAPHRVPNGIAYVLDLGGSHLRVAVISMESHQWHFLTPVKSRKIPWQRNVPFPARDYLAMQADLLVSLNYPLPCPLGYCFSYPADSLENGDAVLIRWTKGIDVPDTVGNPVGALLAAFIQDHAPALHITGVKVINDTVACLFSGLLHEKADAAIGLIVGTGHNMACFFSLGHIPKLNKTTSAVNQLAVNLESGNFVPPFLNDYDRMIDTASENPGEQRMEKAVSGLYLGRLFKAACPESPFDADAGAKNLVALLNNTVQAPEPHRKMAEQIYLRSAKLVAAQLAGLIVLLSQQSPIQSVNIAAEGGLFWSRVSGQHQYCRMVSQTLDQLLRRKGLQDMTVNFVQLADANLAGAAMAALA